MRIQTFQRVPAAILAAVGMSLLLSTSAHAGVDDVAFICEDSGAGLSAVDVLTATGEHAVFLEYLRAYDPEGYEILTDPAASDKTIWAPTDSAFAALGDAPQNAAPEDVKAVLGHHITPPRRSPEGDYPIVTFDYLADGGQIIHQTRTGILTGSDQRVRTRVQDGVYTIQDVRIGPTAWCTQAGSIFSIDEVITEVATPSWLERTLGTAIYIAFFEYPYVTALAALSILVGVIAMIIRARRARRY